LRAPFQLVFDSILLMLFLLKLSKRYSTFILSKSLVIKLDYQGLFYSKLLFIETPPHSESKHPTPSKSKNNTFFHKNIQRISNKIKY
jgi:hypothetical protein